MGNEYQQKKFFITGLVSLEYKTYSYGTTLPSGAVEKSEEKIFEQRYELGLKGYIWNPRFAIFSSSIGFLDNSNKFNGSKSDTKSLMYDASLNLFPGRPLTASFYASKMNNNSKTDNYAPIDASSNSYGMSFTFTKRKFPTITLSYDHWDYTTERLAFVKTGGDNSDYTDDWDNFDDGDGTSDNIIRYKLKLIPIKRERDRYKIKAFGNIKFLKSRYTLTYEIIKNKSIYNNYTTKNLSLHTWSLIKKHTLTTDFFYSDNSLYNMTIFRSWLNLQPIGRLNQSYSLEYLTSEYKTSSSNSQANTIDSYGARALYSYKFTSNFRMKTDLYYRHIDRNGNKENNYKFDINYERLIKGLHFVASYGFSYLNDDAKHLFNSLDLRLSTRSLKWGRFYTIFNTQMQNYDQGNAIEYSWILGANVKGLRRVSLSIENEFYHAKSSGTILNVNPVFTTSLSSTDNEYSYDTISCSLSYPVFRGFVLNAQTSYTKGIKPESFSRYYYDLKINYRILRNLFLLAKWREEAQRYSDKASNVNIHDYEFQMNYQLRSIFLSLTYKMTKSEEPSFERNDKQLYLSLKRPFAF